MMKVAAQQLSQSCQSYDDSSRRASSTMTVFCDFDGPIVDVSDRYYSTYQQGLLEVQAFYQSQGIEIPLHVLSKEQFWQMKQERVPDLEIALRSGLRGQQIDEFLQRVRSIVNCADLLHQDRLQPGVKWALSLLHAQGVRLVLVTLRRQSQAVQLLQDNGLADLFTQIRGTQDDDAAYANQAKHKTQLLAEVMADYRPTRPLSGKSKPLGVEAWMIGDTEADILAGQAMNVPTIALTCGIRSQSYLQRFAPTQIRPDLLSAAHFLFQSRYAAA